MRSEPIFAVLRQTMLVLFVLAFASCGTTNVLHPTFPDGGMLATAEGFPAARLRALEGMYTISEDGPLSGKVALHAAPAAGTLSIFAAANAAYAVLRGGCIEAGSRVVFEGAWRHPRASAVGLVRLIVDDATVAAALCRGDALERLPGGFTLSGATGSGSALPEDASTFTFERELIDASGRFIVAAHHGACRTIDDCGASENSVASIRMVESFGASVVELDVRMTADGVPILYHDENFTPRLSDGTYCHGAVGDFTLADIRTLCRLKFGEEVPTLEDALEAAFVDTSLRGVWLDLKTVAAVGPALTLANAFNARAASAGGRPFRVVLGLPDEAILESFLATPEATGTPCLVELEPADVRRAGCNLWGPRWTRGPMADEVAALQAEGRGVVYWTIDDPAFLDLFLTEGRPNGVLSDRPGLVFQRFQEIGVVPEGSVSP
jgi:glycerophosphoryl diester phosphodiesterase